MAAKDFNVPGVPARKAAKKTTKGFPRHAPARPAKEPGTASSGAPPHAAIERELREWDKTRPNYHPENFISIEDGFRQGRQDVPPGDLAYGNVGGYENKRAKSPRKPQEA